jgi:hypothetical protein
MAQAAAPRRGKSKPLPGAGRILPLSASPPFFTGEAAILPSSVARLSGAQVYRKVLPGNAPAIVAEETGDAAVGVEQK